MESQCKELTRGGSWKRVGGALYLGEAAAISPAREYCLIWKVRVGPRGVLATRK